MRSISIRRLPKVRPCTSALAKSKKSVITVRRLSRLSHDRDSLVCPVDGNMSVQKKFVQKEFNFGLQERFTGTVMPVEDNDFRAELYQSSNSDIRCVSSRSIEACDQNAFRACLSIQVSSSDLQRLLFGEHNSIVEQDQLIGPTPSKRLKSSSTNDGDDEV